VIRTSGEMRLSNFLLWQLAYAEILVTQTLWPEFRGTHLLESIAEYQKRERRYGGLTDTLIHPPKAGGARPIAPAQTNSHCGSLNPDCFVAGFACTHYCAGIGGRFGGSPVRA